MSQHVPARVDPARIDHVALPAGAAIDRYVVREVLGQGGFGITYRAHDTRLDREVAIKEYLPAALAVRKDGASVLPRSTEAAADFGWGRERFLEEGRTLAGLHQAPAIVKVFDFLEANGTAYMVMERLRGTTLEERVHRRGPIDAAALEILLWPLLAGLQTVHAAGFLHRDIKPANIVVGDNGRATLIDFGASRAAMAGRTRTMTAIFTPGFAAPEQFSASRQGAWTDIYGLAATLVFALTGAAPPSAVDRLMEESYEPLASRPPPGASPALLAGIDAGLVLPVEQRPQDIADWRALLRGGATVPGEETTQVMATAAVRAPSRLNTPPTPPTPPSPPSALAVTPPGRSRRPGWIALAVVATLALAGAGIGVWSHLGSSAPPASVAAAPPSTPAPAPATPPMATAPPRPTIPVRPAAPAAPTRASHFAGALSGSATGGGAPSLAPVTVDLQAGEGALNGRLVHPACGSLPVILSVAGDGSVSGSLRLWEATGCGANAARATGRIAGRSLALELRGVDVAYKGTLSAP